MSGDELEDTVSFYFRVSSEQADQFNQLAAAQFGMKKGAKRQMFLKLIDDHLRCQKIAQLKEEISVLEREGEKAVVRNEWSSQCAIACLELGRSVRSCQTSIC
ncbi:hypothetical protein J7400_21080 [Shimia sp. R9_2]|uniref:hypothetical protein n=1 Tax=Shimia sp. R9_2 TaxID=2821112 RepID=UPI001AD9C30D|nr:hypothetical protein [Shimia sp. R9_2]MBO9399170.1 hypothetical protein [Shimia sp. R9_2]